MTQEVTGATTTTRTYNGQQLATVTAGGSTSRYLYDPYGNTDCVVVSSWAASSCPTEGNTLLEDYVYDYANRQPVGVDQARVLPRLNRWSPTVGC